MAKLGVFEFISLDGYYKAPNNDISWHEHDQEGAEYSSQSLQADNILLFGRVTYEMMASFWPTAQAAQIYPDVAKGMNSAEKIVFSKNLKAATWNNTRIISKNIEAEVAQLKQNSKKDLTILGSGSIMTLLAQKNLIDDYQFMIDPLALGNGTSIFKGLEKTLKLKLKDIKKFKSGALLVSYSAL